MRVLNTGRADLRVEAIGEWLAHGEDTAPRASPGFEDGDAIPEPIELVGGGQSGQSRADDDDPWGRLCSPGCGQGERSLKERSAMHASFYWSRTTAMESEEPVRMLVVVT